MDSTPEVNKTARILIIDDEERSASMLARILEKAGYAICITITDPALATERFRQLQPDLVLLDLHMEPISGIEVLARINATLPPRSRPPVLVLTADTTPEAKRQALAAGATDFLAKPLDPIEVLLRIQHLLAARTLFLRCQHYSEGLERLVEKRTAELQQQTRDLEQTLAELQETQQQVIQQERLRALGTMASGIAHDMNNGLSLILGYGDMLLSNVAKFPDGSKERGQLESVVRAGWDNAAMVKRLREFYRPCATCEERQPVDLNELVGQTITLTAPRWQAEAEARGVTIRIATELGAVPLIAGAQEELREVLTNLIFNAVDAMPRGGELCFRTREMGAQVRLEVSDTGTGMADATRRQCLEPFFTTKGDSGSGLGLAMSYGIIRRHGGDITVESRVGHGTTFTLHLPVPEEAVQPLTPPPHRPMRPLRVLVVDDQAGICEIVSAYLAEDRHIVETASGGRQAMAKFLSGHFDLVITDRAMPEFNGDELAAAIKRMQPHEPVIMLTGFADLLQELGERTECVDLVVSKPARLEDLRRAIRAVFPGR